MQPILETFQTKSNEVADKEQFDQDPLGAIREEQKRTQAAIEEMRQERTQAEQARTQQEQLSQQIAQQEAAFIEQHPDYEQALNFMRDARSQEMKLFGVPEDQVAAAVSQEELQIAQQALSTGQNPAELIWQLASTRGYGSKPTAAPETAQTPTVDGINKGQAAAATLSETSGQADESVANLADMSDEEFDAYWDKEMKGAAEPNF